MLRSVIDPVIRVSAQPKAWRDWLSNQEAQTGAHTAAFKAGRKSTAAWCSLGKVHNNVIALKEGATDFVESAYNTVRDRNAQGKIIVDMPGAEHGEKVLDALEGT